MSVDKTTLEEPRFRLDTRSGQLWREEEPVALTNKAFQLLRYFVEYPKRVLSRTDILDRIWPEISVSESLVREYVHDLRVALGDDADAPKYIETVRGRGYRYLGGIDHAASAISLNTGPPRVVVLPWQQDSDPDQTRLFGRGFSSELLTLLARNRDLAVIAKSSASTLAGEHDQIGKARQALRADYAIEGEVIPDGNSVRLALNAVNTDTETIIWSDSFTVPESQLSPFETELVPRVAMAIGGRSGPILHDATNKARRRLPSDLTAFEQYLLALDAYEPQTTPGIEKAHSYLGQALRTDPGHAQSWLLLSYILEHIADHGPAEEADDLMVKRDDAIGRAAELDPNDGCILIENADRLYQGGDTEASSRGYFRAYDMNRGAADVLTLVAKYLAGVICDEKEARKALQVARDLNPVGDNLLNLNELRTLYILGDFDAAINVADGCPDTQLRSVFVALCRLEKGEHDIAKKIMAAEIERNPDFEPTRYESHHYVREPRVKSRFISGLKQLSAHVHDQPLRAIKGGRT